MKRKSIWVVLLILLLYTPVYGANNVSEMDIECVLSSDGSALITQVWQGTFTEGTENYIVIENLNGMTISDFSVSDEKGAYTLLPTWNVKASFSEKARTCGIVETANGYELCFGISEYGSREYRFSYRVHGMAASYGDYDGFLFMFVNPDMSTFPTQAKVRIYLENGTPLNEENSGIWAFGYRGDVQFENGAVVAKSASQISGSDSMIVMLQLNKGILTPIRQVSGTFEEVKEEAFRGSDYDGNSEGAGWIVLIIFLIIVSVIIAVIIASVRRSMALKKLYREAAYFRDTPNKGDLALSYFLSKHFSLGTEEDSILSASILRMIHQGSLIPITTETMGLFGKVKSRVELKLEKEPQDDFLLPFYDILKNSSGEDGVLQEKELANYAASHPQKLKLFIDQAQESGARSFKENGGFTGSFGWHPKTLSPYGKEALLELMGLKKYLLEFSLIREREVQETIIWQEYLVYASLMGIADKVMDQFKKFFPQALEEYTQYNQTLVLAMAYRQTMYRSMTHAIQQQRSSGGGGFSSIGGGGGFSGGGSGGGSR